MRIASGVTDQYLYFIAVDETNFTTRETGLATFTVYRSRNGGTATAMTTPTIAELSAANMPGVYSLLLDEDMTIDAGDETQEMAFHITHAGMAPVTRTIELYRPKITVGNTLDVTSTGAAGIDWGNVENQSTSVNLSATTTNLVNTTTTNTDMRGTDSALLAASAPTNFGDLAITVTTGQVTVGTNNDKTGYSISGTLTTLDALDTQQDSQHSTTQGLIGTPTDFGSGTSTLAANLQDIADDGTAVYNRATDSLQAIRDRGDAAWLTAAAADIRAAVGLASANLDTQLSTIDANVDAVLLDTGTDGVVVAAASKTGYSISGTKTTLDALNDLSAANVNTEVVDALATDTYAEPGQGAPAATTSLAAKINYLYKSWRNKSDNDGSTIQIYDDAGTTVDQKATVSEAAGTVTRGEIASGP